MFSRNICVSKKNTEDWFIKIDYIVTSNLFQKAVHLELEFKFIVMKKGIPFPNRIFKFIQ